MYMNEIEQFPVRYRKNIGRLVEMLSTDAETAFSMMVMTATLMDLRPDDDEVVEMILMDCDMEVRA